MKTATLTREKLDQAGRLVRNAGVDAWMLFDRETADGGDPALPLVLDGGLTWDSALIVTREGRTIAIVGNFDAPPLEASGDWDEVIPYVQGIRGPLLEVLNRVCGEDPKVAVNYSLNDSKADGLSHGMYLKLCEMLRGTSLEGCLESAEPIVMALRARKSPEEVRRIRSAIKAGDDIFALIGEFARIGRTELEVFDYVQSVIDSKGYGYGWDRAGNPIVNSGPDSMIGHGKPSASITIEEGHVFHIDLGVILSGYSSDIQRCWYVGSEVPPDVQNAAAVVNQCITNAAAALKPGVQGWEVDAIARKTLTDAGYEEYMHALGHQVGRVAHDGGAIIGPRWERYGATPTMPVHEGEVYTLELGVVLAGRGYLGIEEIVQVTKDGCEFLSERQMQIPCLSP